VISFDATLWSAVHRSDVAPIKRKTKWRGSWLFGIPRSRNFVSVIADVADRCILEIVSPGEKDRRIVIDRESCTISPDMISTATLTRMFNKDRLAVSFLPFLKRPSERSFGRSEKREQSEKIVFTLDRSNVNGSHVWVSWRNELSLTRIAVHRELKAELFK